MPHACADILTGITTLHTLGPTGTNLEAAAHAWFRQRDREGDVQLHDTLESALPGLPRDGYHALLACAVYPDLHYLVFGNLERLQMVDGFLMPTHNMVLASRGGGVPVSVATHPAPRSLVPRDARVSLVTSNARAAAVCRDGSVEGCITTLPAARAHGLRILHDFGPVPMVFTVHLVTPATEASA
jgi:hypothetical protein